MPVFKKIRRRLSRSLGLRRRAAAGTPEEEYDDHSTIRTHPPSNVVITSPTSTSALFSPVSICDIGKAGFHTARVTDDLDDEDVSKGIKSVPMTPPQMHKQKSSSSDELSEASSIMPQMEKAPGDVVISRAHVSSFGPSPDIMQKSSHSEATSIISTTNISPTTLPRRTPLRQIDENLPPTTSSSSVASRTVRQNLAPVFVSNKESTHEFVSSPRIVDDRNSSHQAVSDDNEDRVQVQASSAEFVGQPTGSTTIPVPSAAATISRTTSLACPSSTKRVIVEKGDRKGSIGTVIGLKCKGALEVRLDDSTIVGKLLGSVRYLEEPIDSAETQTRSDHGIAAGKDIPQSQSVPIESEPAIQVRTESGTALQPDDHNPALSFAGDKEARDPSPEDVGKRVRITTQENRGKIAEIVEWNGKKSYKVKLVSNGQVVTKRATSVEFCREQQQLSSLRTAAINEKEQCPSTANADEKTTEEVPCSQSRNDQHEESESRPEQPGIPVSTDRPTATKPGHNQTDHHNAPLVVTRSRAIITPEADKLASRRTRNGGVLADRCAPQSENGSSYSSRTTSTRRSQSIPFLSSKNPGDTLRLGRRKVLEITLQDDPKAEKGDTMFLSHFFGDRMLKVKVKMAGAKQQNFDKTAVIEGRHYELISVKIDDDVESSWIFGRAQAAKLVYVRTSGSSNDADFNVSKFLLQFGDFSVLDSRKIAARLDLLQSPARFDLLSVRDSIFCDIEERGNVGCGFIAEEYLKQILIKGKMGKRAAELVTAIQVRLFIPRKGIYKGMLQRKRIVAHRTQIQLPPSMQKVPATKFPIDDDTAWILVCQAGVHPSPGSANEYIGRKLDTRRKSPPEKSFTTAIRKPLSDMVTELWKSVKVPVCEIQKYKKESLKPERRNHAWVVGVADPTGSLPPDTVYIPGMASAQADKIFVSRSPCLKHDDARLLQTVSEKPSEMSQDDWNQLMSLAFGSIVFSRPRDAKISIPERIACGDLDGDLYFICWDDIILSHMIDVDLMVDQPMKDDDALEIVPSNSNWLEEAHELMTKAGFTNQMGKLVGKLYKLSEKIAEKSPLLKRDPDAIALAEAYNEALEFKKHGRPIRVPRHLQKDIPKSLQSLVTFL